MGITTHPGEEECEVSCAKLAVGHRKKAVSNHAKRNLSAWTCRGKWVRCDVLMGTVLVSLNIEFVISACGDGRLPGKDTTARSLPPRSCHCQLGGFKPTGDRCCKNVNVDFLARYFGEGQNAAYKPALLFIWTSRVCRAVQSPCRFVFPTSMISFAWSAETGLRWTSIWAKYAFNCSRISRRRVGDIPLDVCRPLPLTSSWSEIARPASLSSATRSSGDRSLPL